jgi:hypothetical protein
MQMTIHRIDNDGNYEPKNVEWANKTKQNRHSRQNHIITFHGRKGCIAEWAEITGIASHVLGLRLNRFHWPLEKALTTATAYRSARHGK